MEENRLLVPCYKALALILAAVVLSSCSLPRIVVFHDPLTPEEHVNLGVRYEKNGELEGALKEYDAASKKLPIAHLYMANIYFQQGEVEKAEKSYKLVIRKTDDPRAYNNLAWLYLTTNKRLDEAEEFARKAVDLSPESKDFGDTLNKIVEKRQTRNPP